MINLIAAVWFLLGFILEILGASLGAISPLACVLAGLFFLAVVGIPVTAFKKTRE